MLCWIYYSVLGLGLRMLIDSSGRNAARAEDAQRTPNQSYISPSVLVYEDNDETRFSGTEVEDASVQSEFSAVSERVLDTLLWEVVRARRGWRERREEERGRVRTSK